MESSQVNKNIYSCYNALYEINSKMLEDSIYYIDLNTCNVNSVLDAQIKKLKERMEDGIKKIIIDVRDNSGGDSNAPSSYGDILYYTLTNSNIAFTLSHKRFLRADQNADPNSVTPDIETDYGEDILSVAVEYLKSLE